jgi:hypothetical protein
MGEKRREEKSHTRRRLLLLSNKQGQAEKRVKWTTKAL